MSASQFEVLLAERPHVLAAVQYGQNQSCGWAKANILLLPRYMKDASDPLNIHYGKVSGFVEDMAFARGLLSEASAFIHLWPRRQMILNYTIREWANSKVSSDLFIQAVPEFLAATNILELSGPEHRQTKQDVYQRWWGLYTLNPREDAPQYEAIGKLSKSPDPVSGYGRGHQYYPSVTQSFLAREKELLKVQKVNEEKKGRITAVYGVDGKRVMKYYQCPYEVDVEWEDGSSERLSYFAVRQLDPLLHKPMICHAQSVLSPYEPDGKPIGWSQGKLSFVKQLAAVLVIASLDSGQYGTMLPAEIVKEWAKISHDFLVPAGVNKRYRNMTYPQGNETLVGWQTPTGQQLMEDIFLAISTGKGEIARLGPKVSQFLDEIENVKLGTVYDSGLVVCPECHNCETLATAQCVDFGIQTRDSTDWFSSIKWQTENLGRGEGVRCVATVKCANCHSLYYRRFETLVRDFSNIISTGGVEAAPEPNLLIDNSASGGGCERAPISAYTFLPGNMDGRRGLNSLPRLRLFGEFEGRVRAADIALEAGTQARNLKKQNFCAGTARVAGGMTSHRYFDQFIGKGGLRGTGDFVGDNKDDWVRTPLTGATVCSWCQQVGQHLNEFVPTHLVPGTYYQGETDFMDIQSESGSTQFDKRDMQDGKGGDYLAEGGQMEEWEDDEGNKFQQMSKEVITQYNLRLVKGGKVRILEVKPKQVGEKILPVDDAYSLDLLLTSQPPCPNEGKYFLGPTLKLFDEFLTAEQKHEGQESRFMICEQLAYSAKKNPLTHSWEAMQPPGDWSGDRGTSSLFRKEGEGATRGLWKEGNRQCVTPKGNRERFPEPRLGKNSAATLVTPYASNQTTRPLPQYHILKEVGWDEETEVTVESGETISFTTPYLVCPECESSYHGAPSEEAGRKWRLPDSVGSDFLRPDAPTRRDDKGGGYSESSNWHFTLPLYTEKKGYDAWVESLTARDPEKLKRMFPEKMVTWLQNQRTFPAKERMIGA